MHKMRGSAVNLCRGMRPIFCIISTIWCFYLWFLMLQTPRQDDNLSRCKSPTMAIYSDVEIIEIERLRAKFEHTLVQDASAIYDKLNIPGIKGDTIWDELRILREPTCIGNNRDCFALWKSIFSCKEKKLLGAGVDGSRFLCSSSTFATRKPCIIYSIGSNGDFGFEEFLLQETQSCTIYTFDCTMGQTPAYNSSFEKLKDKHWFHPWCLSAQDGVPNSNYMTLATIHERLKHSWGTLALLKMDIEAFEHKVLANFQKSDRFLPEQLILEVHSTTEPISGAYRYKSIGELTLFLLQLMRLGYRLVHVQPEGGGVDATFIRVMCWITWVPRMCVRQI